MKLLSLNNDSIFKLIFGENSDLLKNLLNSILQSINEDEIQNLEILDSKISPKDSILQRNQFQEIRAKDNEGRHFIAETDTLPEKIFLKRTLLNLQEKDEDCEETKKKKTYTFNFLNANITSNTEYMSTYRISEMESSFKHTESFQICIIEFPKFKKTLHELRNSLDRWIYLLKNSGRLTEEQAEKLEENDEPIQKTLTELKIASSDSKNWAIQIFRDSHE